MGVLPISIGRLVLARHSPGELHQIAEDISRTPGLRLGTGCRRFWNQQVQQPLFDTLFRLAPNLFGHLAAHLAYGCLHQVPDHALHVPAHIANFCVFARLHLHKGRAGQPGQTAGDFCFADAGGADHQNVVRQDLLADLVLAVAPPPAVAQGDGHRPFGIFLADDVAVQLFDDLPGGQVQGVFLHSAITCIWSLV